jgi:catechol-2,3-dioxygenase
MTSLESVTLEVAVPTAARRFYTDAFGLGTELRLRASEAQATGFRDPAGNLIRIQELR